MSEKVIAYQIITSKSADGLGAEVERQLADGWDCLGGVSVSCDIHYDCFAQAMVKREVNGE